MLEVESNIVASSGDPRALACSTRVLPARPVSAPCNHGLAFPVEYPSGISQFIHLSELQFIQKSLLKVYHHDSTIAILKD